MIIFTFYFNNHVKVSIEEVLDESRKVCLKMFVKEPFKPSGWMKVKKRTVSLTQNQQSCLKLLWNWRDETARVLDESQEYVCPKYGLFRIASSLPSNVATLQRLINPMPPPILQFSQEILDIVQSSLRGEQLENRELMEGKIASSNRRDMASTQKHTSDILVKNEAARNNHVSVNDSWVQSCSEDNSESNASSVEDETEGYDNCAQYLDPANQNFLINRYMDHSIELDKVVRDNGRTMGIPGVGSIEAALKLFPSLPRCAEESIRIAFKSTTRILNEVKCKEALLLSNPMAVDRTATDAGDEEGESRNLPPSEEKIDTPLDEPKSLQELYGIKSKKKRTRNVDQSNSSRDKRFCQDNALSEKLNDHKASIASGGNQYTSSEQVSSVPDLSIGLIGNATGSAMSNPFFSGAALALESVSSLASKVQKDKKQKPKKIQNMKKRANAVARERPQSLSGKTHVYRK